MERFGWIKYEIKHEVITATKVRVFTALQQEDSVADLAVGYYIDLPGRCEVCKKLHHFSTIMFKLRSMILVACSRVAFINHATELKVFLFVTIEQTVII